MLEGCLFERMLRVDSTLPVKTLQRGLLRIPWMEINTRNGFFVGVFLLRVVVVE